MKMLTILCVAAYIGTAATSNPPPASTGLSIAPSPGGYSVKSGNLGGNFAYSASENRAYLPPYAAYSPVVPQRPVFSPYLTYAFLPQGFGHNQIFTGPIYPGQIAAAPIFGSPFYPGQVVFGDPGAATHPLLSSPFGPGPVLQQPIGQPGVGAAVTPPGGIAGLFPFPGGIGGGGGGGGGGIQGDAPAIPPGQAAPTPVQGTVVDEDTVAVEAA